MISLSQRPLPDNTQQSQETDIHNTFGIRTRNPSKRSVADPHLRSLGHSDRQIIVFFYRNSPTWARAASCSRFLDHTQIHTTVGRSPLDEGSARRRDLYLTTHNTQNRQTATLPAGFEPAIPASKRLQTLALDRTAAGIGKW
jgi:hypothetical protein